MKPIAQSSGEEMAANKNLGFCVFAAYARHNRAALLGSEDIHVDHHHYSVRNRGRSEDVTLNDKVPMNQLFDDDDLEASPTEVVGTKLPAHLQKLVDLLPLNQRVHRSQLEEAYGRSNYARRIRKIIAEYGWDIERFRGNAGANDDWYIRRSDGPVRRAHIRREVAPKIRTQIYERDDWICQMCGAETSTAQGLTRAQCDHKVPAERGGASMPHNLQTLCLQCNLKKRQACRHCDLPSCDNCPYAFPEKFASVLVLRLPPEAARKLAQMSDEQGEPPGIVVTRLIDQGLLPGR